MLEDNEPSDESGYTCLMYVFDYCVCNPKLCQDVHAILFCVALDEYDLRLREDDGTWRYKIDSTAVPLIFLQNPRKSAVVQ